MNELDRYWILGFPNPSNKVSEASAVTGLNLVGLVDEEAGGVIGYLVDDAAADICTKLNALDVAGAWER